jgi:hypothetical protein
LLVREFGIHGHCLLLHPFSIRPLHIKHGFIGFWGQSVPATQSSVLRDIDGLLLLFEKKGALQMQRVVLGQAVSVASLVRRSECRADVETETPAGTQEQSEHAVATEPATEDVEGMPVVVPMTAGAGTPIKVALDAEVRIRDVGQAIHGRTTEPVYAFDKLLIPVGTVVNGKVSAIDAVPKTLRTMQAANGNFSPAREVHVQFNELVMANERTVSLHTVASPAPYGVLRFVSALAAERIR